ncbi:MAG TPA: spherulation-specific family 4 protein, partial [Polyangia bacterium]|nr:spherulation-specific family 4 protein [Polyangia bacterium]
MRRLVKRDLGWAAGLCLALAACNVNGGQGAHDGGTGGSFATGTGGSGGAGMAIHIDGGAIRRGTIKMVVPAYYAPGPDWQRIIAASDVVGMIIFNPASGPGTVKDPAYVSAIAQAQAAGILVLGYVATDYGQRAEADINSDVNGYYDLYQLSGVYFAEGPMASECDTLEPEYRRLTALALSRDP